MGKKRTSTGAFNRSARGKNLRRRGAGFWDFLILISFLAAGVIIAQFYIASKKAPPLPAPVIVQAPPAPAPSPPPQVAPVVPAQPTVARPPAADSELAVAVLPHAPPPVPESKKLEKELEIALEAAIAAEGDLDTARKECLARFQQSPEYLQAKADAESKRRQKESAAEKFRQDDAAALDTVQDQADLKSASQDWIAAVAKLTQLENDAVSNDPVVAEKQKIAAATSADEQEREAKLNDEVRRQVLRCVDGDDCAVQSVHLSPFSLVLKIELAPARRDNSGAMADAAMRQIGRILEFGLYKSPFTWDLSEFSVVVDYHKKKAVEFQPRFLRSDVDQAHFDSIDRRNFDNMALVKLACDIWLSPVVDDMQGGDRVSVNVPAPTAAYREGPRIDTVKETLDSLVIGGYLREDGSYCPVTLVYRTHVEPPTSSYTAIIPRRMAMPPLYSKTGLPGAIVTQPPDPLIPPD